MFGSQFVHVIGKCFRISLIFTVFLINANIKNKKEEINENL